MTAPGDGGRPEHSWHPPTRRWEAVTSRASEHALRIALVTPRFGPDPGGVQTHVAHLAAELGAAGHRVQLITQASATEPLRTVAGAQVRSLQRSERWPIELPVPSLLWAVRRADVDLVHVHDLHTAVALGSAMVARAPVVLTAHSHPTSTTALRQRLRSGALPLERRVVDSLPAVIAVSDAERAALLHRHPRLAERLTTIPNGVDDPFTAEPFPRPYRTVLTCSRLVQHKRVDRLIAAMAFLPNDLELVIVGDGPLHEVLSRMAAAYGISDRVRFTGVADEHELERWYATASAFVTLSNFEAFGLSLAGALVRGIPAVASAIPGHVEVARRAGATVGFVDPDPSPVDVAEAIANALTMVSPVGVALRTLDGLPRWRDVCTRTVELYRGVLEHTTAGRIHRPRLAA